MWSRGLGVTCPSLKALSCCYCLVRDLCSWICVCMYKDLLTCMPLFFTTTWYFFIIFCIFMYTSLLASLSSVIASQQKLPIFSPELFLDVEKLCFTFQPCYVVCVITRHLIGRSLWSEDRIWKDRKLLRLWQRKGLLGETETLTKEPSLIVTRFWPSRRLTFISISRPKVLCRRTYGLCFNQKLAKLSQSCDANMAWTSIRTFWKLNPDWSSRLVPWPVIGCLVSRSRDTYSRWFTVQLGPSSLRSMSHHVLTSSVASVEMVARHRCCIHFIVLRTLCHERKPYFCWE